MSFLEKVPQHIETLEAELVSLNKKLLELDFGHVCDCEYCDVKWEGADPEVDQKVEAIDKDIEEHKAMIGKLRAYQKLFESKTGVAQKRNNYIGLRFCAISIIKMKKIPELTEILDYADPYHPAKFWRKVAAKTMLRKMIAQERHEAIVEFCKKNTVFRGFKCFEHGEVIPLPECPVCLSERG